MYPEIKGCVLKVSDKETLGGCGADTTHTIMMRYGEQSIVDIEEDIGAI